MVTAANILAAPNDASEKVPALQRRDAPDAPDRSFGKLLEQSNRTEPDRRPHDAERSPTVDATDDPDRTGNETTEAPVGSTEPPGTDEADTQISAAGSSNASAEGDENTTSSRPGDPADRSISRSETAETVKQDASELSPDETADKPTAGAKGATASSTDNAPTGPDAATGDDVKADSDKSAETAKTDATARTTAAAVQTESVQTEHMRSEQSQSGTPQTPAPQGAEPTGMAAAAQATAARPADQAPATTTATSPATTASDTQETAHPAANSDKHPADSRGQDRGSNQSSDDGPADGRRHTDQARAANSSASGPQNASQADPAANGSSQTQAPTAAEALKADRMAPGVIEAGFRETLPGGVTSQAPGSPTGLAAAFGSDIRLGTDSATNISQQAARSASMPTPAANQLAVQISKALQDGNEKLQVHLRPASLGSISVQIEMTHDNRLIAVIAAEKADTLDLLQRDARLLERALNDAGIKTDSGSLNFSLQDDGAAAGDREELTGSTENWAAIGDGEDPDGVPTDMPPARLLTPDRVDIQI